MVACLKVHLIMDISVVDMPAVNRHMVYISVVDRSVAHMSDVKKKNTTNLQLLEKL